VLEDIGMATTTANLDSITESNIDDALDDAEAEARVANANRIEDQNWHGAIL